MTADLPVQERSDLHHDISFELEKDCVPDTVAHDGSVGDVGPNEAVCIRFLLVEKWNQVVGSEGMNSSCVVNQARPVETKRSADPALSDPVGLVYTAPRNEPRVGPVFDEIPTENCERLERGANRGYHEADNFWQWEEIR
jgi:hypothetical protein